MGAPRIDFCAAPLFYERHSLNQPGMHTYNEITSQPTIWQDALSAFAANTDALQALWEAGGYTRILFTGCGSTYYLAMVGAALFQELTGVNARAYPGSEIALLPELALAPKDKTLLITVSRSGETTETVQAVRVFRERTGSSKVVAVTCGSSSTLSLQADLNISIDSAQETSLAQTRSFASMLIVVQRLAALIAGLSDREVPEKLTATVARLLSDYAPLAKQLGEDRGIERFFFLGSGALHGIANEAMLKMKEMSLSYSEAFHMLEFRHGPMSMVDGRALVIGLIGEQAAPQEIAVLRDMKARGAQILAISEQDYGLDEWAHTVPLASGLPRWVRPVTYLPVLQLMAYHRALANGQNPDQPANLSFVIALDNSMT
jgi:glucosamine--fructose-6-phosphate aminotransferase (isomerizing)